MFNFNFFFQKRAADTWSDFMVYFVWVCSFLCSKLNLHVCALSASSCSPALSSPICFAVCERAKPSFQLICNWKHKCAVANGNIFLIFSLWVYVSRSSSFSWTSLNGTRDTSFNNGEQIRMTRSPSKIRFIRILMFSLVLFILFPVLHRYSSTVARYPLFLNRRYRLKLLSTEKCRLKCIHCALFLLAIPNCTRRDESRAKKKHKMKQNRPIIIISAIPLI